MRFAHISDVHLGFQKYEALKRIEQETFEKVIDRCISEEVDFVLISGDLFHVNIPEMYVQKYAFAKFRKIHDKGIPVYVVYGSHDFSPVSNSVIDLLDKTGFITKVVKVSHQKDNKISLEFVTDPKTGAKICGLSGLKTGRDRDHYENLDREGLEAEQGFKIFMFHGGIAEMRTDTVPDGDHMPLSLLPKGFSYYAGGHMHRYNHQEFANHLHVVYPGTTFAGYYSDLDDNANGQERGFVIAEFDEKITKVSRINIPNVAYEQIRINGKNKSAESVNKELVKKVHEVNSAEKIIIITVSGEMMSGKTSEVDVAKARASLYQNGAYAVEINTSKLSSLEYKITDVRGENRVEIESNVFDENIGQLRFKHKELAGDSGVNMAKSLLTMLRQPELDNEKKGDYESRIRNDTFGVLGLNQDDS